jgi:formamidopyrimidine-DNA glycosylase
VPELPEVETTRRGIAPHVIGRRITAVTVRNPRLRYPVTGRLASLLTGREVAAVERRGKYLWLSCGDGALILHLGMSGSLCVVPDARPVRKHDHVDIHFERGQCLRLHDPRRFSMVVWTSGDPLHHPLLRDIGVEPLDAGLDGDYLYRCSRGRRVSVKQFIMDGRIVAGVGNIYANEALFTAGIAPQRSAGRVSQQRYAHLAEAIRRVLTEAITQGGTTLRDFYHGDGQPGYFQHRLSVYQRHGAPCRHCGRPIHMQRQGQRSSFYCRGCQR